MSTVEEEAIRARDNHHGVREESLPVSKTLDVAELRERMEKLNGNLHTLRSQRESLTQQVEDVNLSINRTEGAILMLQALVNENAPVGG